MVEYKQFYTELDVSVKLSDSIESLNPAKCLELSAGQGALISAILNKYPKISVTAVDIDYKNANFLKDKFQNIEVICGDSTLPTTYNLIPDESYDIALCNPPFKNILSSKFTSALISEFTEKEYNNKYIRAEIIFLLMNLKKLKPLGELVIILPDMFLTSLQYSWLRKILVDKFNVVKVIECDHNSFKNTEAKTHIYHVTKLTDHEFKLIGLLAKDKEYKIDKNDFVAAKEKYGSSHEVDRLFVLFRGGISGKECKLSGLPYFHTTSFAVDTTCGKIAPDSLGKCTVKGDILIARVGTRVIGKTTIFNGVSALVSDCIFCLRITNIELKNFFLKHWNTDKKDWLEKNAKGTCAKNISLTIFRDYVRSILALYSPKQ